MSLLYAWLSAGPDTPLTVVSSVVGAAAAGRRRASELRSRVTHLERGLTVDRDALVDVLRAGRLPPHEPGRGARRGRRARRHRRPVPAAARPAGADRVRLRRDRLDPPLRPGHAALRGRARPRGGDPAARLPAAERPRRADPGSAADGPRAEAPRVADLQRDARRSRAARCRPASRTSRRCCTRRHGDGVRLPARERARGGRRSGGRPARALSFIGEVFTGHEQAAAQDRLVCDPLALHSTDESAWQRVLQHRPVLLDPIGVIDATADEEVVDARGADHRELRREIEEQRGSGPRARAAGGAARRLDRQASGACGSPRRRRSARAPGRHPARLRPRAARRPRATRGRAGRTGRRRARSTSRSSPLADGFELPDDQLVVVAEPNIFGERRAAPRRCGSPASRARWSGSAQIQEGDFLVHAEHGIAPLRRAGPHLRSVGGEQEFLLLLYEKGDKLYVPVSRLGQVQRYSSADDAAPALDRLGGQIWTKTKARVRRAVRDMAEELLAVIAARDQLPGPRVPRARRRLRGVRGALPLRRHPDQRKATDDVLARHAARAADGPAGVRRRRLRQDRGRLPRGVPGRVGGQAGRLPRAHHRTVSAAPRDAARALRRQTAIVGRRAVAADARPSS